MLDDEVQCIIVDELDEVELDEVLTDVMLRIIEVEVDDDKIADKLVIINDEIDINEYLYYVIQQIVDTIYLDELVIFVEITQFTVSLLAEL